MKRHKVGQIINRVKDTIVIENGQDYKRLTIRMYHKGVCLRDIELGENIGTKNQYKAQSGQFIMSRIDARNGAFGIIPEDIGDAAITNDFLSFTVNEELVDIEYFELYSQTDSFMQLCIEGSKGTTNRKRLKEEVFLEFEVYLPEIDRQIQIVNQVKRLQLLNKTLDAELYFQNKAVQNLRQSILQEAFQGKLVPQDSKDEPARVLMKKIKVEREQLIKEGKIKKEKPLPQISEEEIPYELPQGWEWVRLQEAYDVRDGTHDTPRYVESGIPLITSKNISGRYLDFGNVNYIAIEDHEIISQRSKVEFGDILFAMIGSIGNPTIVETDKQFSIKNVALFKYYNHDLVCRKYLWYYLTKVSLEMQNQALGGVQKFVSLSYLRNFIFPIPPLNEQKRIVKKVDALMTLCDDLERTVEQSKLESEMLMQAVLLEAFNATEKEVNVIEFPTANSNDTEDWEIAARSDGEINSETKSKIKNRVTEVLGKFQR
jgi:type I restriction enzyme, S subunit